jgi:choline-sulfatase
MDAEPVTEAETRAARRAYLGAISYVDDQLGRLMAALKATGLAENTVVVLTSDHGEMLGDRGLWYKMNFFEGASRVPLIVAWPGRFAPRRVAASVSLLDLAPTLADLTGVDDDLGGPIDGRSLLPHLEGRAGHDEALGEYLAEGAIAPMVMIRRRALKFIHSPPDPDQLYDLAADPGERANLAADPAHAETVAAFRDEVARRWRLNVLDAEVRASQRRRRLVAPALMTGAVHAWDYQPLRDATRQYIRSGVDLDDLEAMSRFPRQTRG